MWKTPMRPVMAVAALLSLVSSRGGAAPYSEPTSASVALSEVDRRAHVLERETAALRKELDELGPRRAAVAMRARVRGRALYKASRAGLLPSGGGFSGFVDYAQRLERLKKTLSLDLRDEAQLGSRAASGSAQLDSMSRELSELQQRRTILAAASLALVEEQRRAEAFERAFGESAGPRRLEEQGMVVYGPNGRTETVETGAFRERRGRLSFPVAGEAEVHATEREGGPALDIRANAGAAVRAVHAGRVAFADRYSGYGLLVILDHGDRYYTLSGNLAGIDIRVGDDVSAGERIGTVGDSGHGPTLYFEIRQGERKLPPGPWLGL